MVYTERDKLTIIELHRGNEKVSIKQLKNVLVKRPSNMIYCETNKKLVGIISVGDILRAHKNGLERVRVNKKFTYLHRSMCGGGY